MPVARRVTPPTSRLKKQLSVLNSLSAWTDTGEEDKPLDKKDKYRELVPDEQREANTMKERLKVWLDVESDNFNIMVGLAIMANAVVIGLETDIGPGSFTVLEHLFNTVFFLEMCLRIRLLGAGYFKEPWNIFDFLLVCSGTLDLWILPLVTMGSTSKVFYRFSVMRMLRILRLLRILRVVRLFRMFQQLYLIMQAFNKAFQIVLLMGLLVLILDYVCAIMLTQGIGRNANMFGDDEEKIDRWFGSIPKSMQTLFLIMTLTNWDEVSLTLVKVFPSPAVYFSLVIYIMVTSYTMLSLITGIISESLITAQQEYRQRKEKTMDEKKKDLASDLRQFLEEMFEDEKDVFNNVRPVDLKTAMRGDQDVLVKLASIGIIIDEHGILALIEKLSNQDQSLVNIDYFVDKLTNLVGSATASSAMDLKFDMYQMSCKLDAIMKKLEIEDPFPMGIEEEEHVAPMYSLRQNEVSLRSSLRTSNMGGDVVGTKSSLRQSLLKDTKPRFSED